MSESAQAASRRVQPESQLLVKCEGGPAGEVARVADIEVGAVRVRDFHALGWHVVGLPDGLSVNEAMARYRARPGILAVEPNAVVAVEPPAAGNGEARMANREGGVGTSRDESEARGATAIRGSRMEGAAPSALEKEQEARRSVPLHSGSWEPEGLDGSPHSLFPTLHSPPTGVIPNDSRFREQWNLRIIGMTNAWAVTTGSSNVVVAVLDTGVDYNHEDLRDNMWRNPGETGLDVQGRDKATNGVDDDANGYVDDVYGIDVTDGDSDPMDAGLIRRDTTEAYYHGTTVAGIIGAVGNNGKGIAGISMTVKIMALRRSDYAQQFRHQSVYTANIVASMNYVLMMRRRGVNVRVTNQSFGTYAVSPAMRDSVRSLGEAGVLVVCAAGNDGLDAGKFSFYPANLDLPYVVSVAATDRSDLLVEYSNHGSGTVDLAAPTEVSTTWLASRYISDFPGTSAACPHVAGAAALLLAVRPEGTPLELKAALMQSVDPKPSLRGRVASHGRLNVARALEAITNASLPAVVVGASPRSSRTATNAVIELWFNRPMNRSSVEQSLEIHPEVSGIFDWTEGDRVVRLLPTLPLARTNHVCRIRGDARDAHGSGIDGNFNRISEGTPTDDFAWEFTFAPTNDDFATAARIQGQEGTVAGTTRNTVFEDDEPLANGYDFFPWTSWYSWKAAASGWVTFEAIATGSVNLVLAAYTGSTLRSLNTEAFNDNDGNSRNRSRVSFPVRADATYSIDVAGRTERFVGSVSDGIGDYSLRWYPTPRPVVQTISPMSGAAGSTVTLQGTNFTGVTRVLFHGVEARFTPLTNTHNFYDRRLTAVVPSGATTGPITIETPQGNGTSTSVFEVLEGPPSLLAVIEADRTLVLSWPATPASAGYLLEATPTLGSPVWSPVGQVVETSGPWNRARVVPSGRGQFYRLKKP